MEFPCLDEENARYQKANNGVVVMGFIVGNHCAKATASTTVISFCIIRMMHDHRTTQRHCFATCQTNSEDFIFFNNFISILYLNMIYIFIIDVTYSWFKYWFFCYRFSTLLILNCRSESIWFIYNRKA